MRELVVGRVRWLRALSFRQKSIAIVIFAWVIVLISGVDRV